jgi:ABC-type microcin C transport system permease subunit YejB
MIVLPKNSSDDEMLNFVSGFVNLLAEEKFVEAFEMTYHDSKYEMSSELIKRLIEGYGFDEPVNEIFRVTSLEKMKSQSFRFRENQRDGLYLRGCYNRRRRDDFRFDDFYK